MQPDKANQPVSIYFVLAAFTKFQLLFLVYTPPNNNLINK